MTQRLISNSEVATYQECQVKWYLAHYLHLKPKYEPAWAMVGTIGHAAMAEMYSLMKEGIVLKDAKMAILDYVDSLMGNYENLVDTGHINATEMNRRTEFLLQVQTMLLNYVEKQAMFDKWEILEVETIHQRNSGYVMRLDLLIRDHGPEAKGAIVVVDHKFLSKFINWKQLEMNCQVPKYIGTLAGEIEIDYGMMNQVLKKKEGGKYRPEFQRAKVPYNPRVFERRLHEQEMASEQIRQKYSMPKEMLKDCLIRTNDPWKCERCLFFEPCSQDLQGQSWDGELEYNFEENTYGYNPAGVE